MDFRIEASFTGKERDTETGLDYFGARYLSSAQGRFTSTDPDMTSVVIENPQSWNRYSYVYNRPHLFVDGSGRYPSVVHHDINKSGFSDLQKEDLAIINNASDWADRFAGQLPGKSYTHAMSNPLSTTCFAPALCKAQDVEKAMDSIDKLLHEAAKAQKASLEAHRGNSSTALWNVGLVAHLLQDDTSVFHKNFQPWFGLLSVTDWIHGVFENGYRSMGATDKSEALARTKVTSRILTNPEEVDAIVEKLKACAFDTSSSCGAPK